MIVSSTAGRGKSYLIHCLQLLVQHQVHVAAPTGVAAFNINGHTLHSLLTLPTRGDLEGEGLIKLRQSFSDIKYIIINEMSMVGRETLGQVDRDLCQAFPHHAQEVFGGCSCLLFGDFGQLPPVVDLPCIPLTPIQNRLTKEEQPIRPSNRLWFWIKSRARLVRIHSNYRDAKVTVPDWNCLMTQTPTHVQDLTPFATALQQLKLLLSTTLLSFMPVASQSPLSRLSTLEPMQPKPQLMMQEGWKQSFV